jgi:hypothetical protein
MQSSSTVAATATTAVSLPLLMVQREGGLSL